jgi:hypothetical protein
MAWACKICGIEHGEVPDCFGIEAPWRALVPEAEFEKRVDLNADLCVVDGKEFFVRGHVEIPVHDHPNPISFSVWSSLSERSFLHMGKRWNDSDRAEDDPYFGWLCTPIHVYPDTIHLKLGVQQRPPGLTPIFFVRNDEHPLAIDQRNGISIARWHEMALKLLA